MNKNNNELIAEFMGFKYLNSREEGNIRVYEVPSGKDLKYRAFKLSHLKFEFDTAWDWLMPVVEKIVSLSFDVHIHSMKNNAGVFVTMTGIDTWNGTPLIHNSDEKPIDSVYQAIVEFIKWHNAQPDIKL